MNKYYINLFNWLLFSYKILLKVHCMKMLSKYQDMAKIVSKTSKCLIKMIYFLRIRP